MRVALDVTPLLGAPTGVHQSVRGLLDALPAAAPDVEVVPYLLSGRARGAALDGLGALAGATRVLPLPAGLAIRAWGRLDRPGVRRWLGDVDVVHGTNFVVPPLPGVPATVTVHDCWCARHPDRCPPAVAAFPAAVRRAVARGAWLHVTTRHGAREVAEVYGAAERVAVIPFGVPTAGIGTPPGASLPPALAGRPFVLALGALDDRKGLDGLVRAFAAVAVAAPGAELALAGPDGSGRAAVDAALAALPPEVRDRVHLLGTVDDGTRRALLTGARVLAYPSLDEGFGFPVLEAMAAGTPVVASTAGALPEVAGDAADLVPVGDDGALAAAVTRALVDDAHHAGRVRAGHARAEGFTWARTAAGLVELWRTAVATAAPR